MKTTVDVPDNLYRQVKAQAALKGQTIKAFLVEALREKLGLTSEADETEKDTGWRAVFGKGDKEEIAEVQKIIDEEFSRIDYAEWGLPEPEDPS